MLVTNLTIYGRVSISKAEGISRIVYPALSLYVDRKTCSSIDSILFTIFWKNQTEYVKRKTLIRNTLEGGGNALDFSTLNQVFKIGWIECCLNADPNLFWFYIPKLIFEKCGGLNFVLACDFSCNKLVMLANFHKQALDACKLAFSKNS